MGVAHPPGGGNTKEGTGECEAMDPEFEAMVPTFTLSLTHPRRAYPPSSALTGPPLSRLGIDRYGSKCASKGNVCLEMPYAYALCCFCHRQPQIKSQNQYDRRNRHGQLFL